MTYLASGYISDEEFAERSPSWEAGERYPTIGDAEEAARVWLADKDDEAVVELVELSLDGREGWVRRLISRGDTEVILTRRGGGVRTPRRS